MNVYNQPEMPLRLPRETLQIEVRTQTVRCTTSRAPQIFAPACTMVRFFLCVCDLYDFYLIFRFVCLFVLCCFCLIFLFFWGGLTYLFFSS